MVILSELMFPWKVLTEPLVWFDEGESWKFTRSQLRIEGAVCPGLFLRIKSPAIRNGHGFLLQIEYQPTDSPRDAFQLERVEWKVGHTNGAIGPSELHFLDIESSHIHKFNINYLVEENRMRGRNLLKLLRFLQQTTIFTRFSKSPNQPLGCPTVSFDMQIPQLSCLSRYSPRVKP